MRLTGAVAAVALTGLLFGFDTAVIAGVTETLRQQYALTPAQVGLTVSSALWGTLVGALTAGGLGDRIGSRDGLRITALLYTVSGLGCAMAGSWTVLLGFRVLAGLAVGLSSVLAPIYLAEVAPAARRGATVGLFQVNLVVGILVAYLSNAGIGAVVADPEMLWRWKLGMTAAPAALCLLLLTGVPPSPRWLLGRGRRAEADRAIRSLYGAVPPPDLLSAETTIRPERVALGRLWREARRPVLLAVAVATLNQLTGINAILYYLNDIFAAAGFGRVSSDMQAIAVGATNLMFTLIAMALLDRVGRRRLLLGGALAMAAMLGVTALVMAGLLPKTILLGVLVLFIASFALSQGAVVWVYLSEIFPTRYRAAGQGIGSAVLWLFDALVAQAFPSVSARSPALPFLIFMVAMLAQWIVVRRAFPETKGVPLEMLEARLGVA